MTIQQYTFIIAAGDVREFTDTVDWVFFPSVGAAGVTLVFNQNNSGQSSILPIAANYYFKSGTKSGFKKLNFKNTTGAPITVSVLSGDGEFSPGAAGAAVSATIVGTPDVNILSTAAGMNLANGVPVKGGAIARTTDVASYADNTPQTPSMDKAGRQLTTERLPELTFTQETAALTGTVATNMASAPGAGLRIYMDSITLANSSAVDTLVQVTDGGTTATRTFFSPAKSSIHYVFPLHPIRWGNNQSVTAQCLTAGANVFAGCTYARGA